MASRFPPYNETSIDGVISAGKDLDMSESTIAFKELIDDRVIIPWHNVLTKYYFAIQRYIVEISFSEQEYQAYYQQPKLFCYNRYGTPELAYSLLYINNMPSMMDFKKRKIKAFTDDILDIINELLSLNEDDLKANAATLKA